MVLIWLIYIMACKKLYLATLFKFKPVSSSTPQGKQLFMQSTDNETHNRNWKNNLTCQPGVFLSTAELPEFEPTDQKIKQKRWENFLGKHPGCLHIWRYKGKTKLKIQRKMPGLDNGICIVRFLTFTVNLTGNVFIWSKIQERTSNRTNCIWL